MQENFLPLPNVGTDLVWMLPFGENVVRWLDFSKFTNARLPLKIPEYDLAKGKL